MTLIFTLKRPWPTSRDPGPTVRWSTTPSGSSRRCWRAGERWSSRCSCDTGTTGEEKPAAGRGTGRPDVSGRPEECWPTLCEETWPRGATGCCRFHIWVWWRRLWRLSCSWRRRRRSRRRRRRSRPRTMYQSSFLRFSFLSLDEFNCMGIWKMRVDGI